MIRTLSVLSVLSGYDFHLISENPCQSVAKKTQNKPNLKSLRNDVSRFPKTVYCALHTVYCLKNKPNSNPISKPSKAESAFDGFIYVPQGILKKRTQFEIQ